MNGMECEGGAIMDLNRSKALRKDEGQRILVVLDRRVLVRELFVMGLEAADEHVRVEAHPSIEAWKKAAERGGVEPCAIICIFDGRRFSDAAFAEEVRAIEAQARPTPLIVVSPHEEISEISAALRLGVRGYIPASLGVQATLLAVQLARHGGIFLPPGSVMDLEAERGPEAREIVFTSRQMAVADALRRGKPNKLIAYELTMCESTVKVHIRNIMKKLGARNRTEASYKINSLPAHQLSELLAEGG